MPQSGRDETWLSALCAKLGVPTDEIRPLLPLSPTYIPSARTEDEDKANLLLAQASEVRRTGECKTTSGSGRINKDKWAYEDYCKVFTEVVNGSGSVGVAESIWNSFQLQKPRKARTGRFARRQQAAADETDDLLFNLMSSTMRYKETDMLHFLAHSASSEVVNRLFPTALHMRSLRSTEILVEENADPNTCPEEFISFVRAGEEDFVRLLLQSQIPLELETVTAALPDAVQRGNATIVRLLLAHGADADAHNGLAVEKAIRSGRTDLALSLLMCQNPPSPGTLAAIVAYVFFKLDVHPDKKYHYLELLLNGGAAGECVSLALGGAVRQHRREVVELFIDKGVSINHYNAEAYRHAVHEVDLETARILNGGDLDDHLATEIFSEIYKTKHGESISNENWRALAELLLDQGATGYAVDEALIERVEARDLESVKLLLRHCASVDYRDAHALGHSVASEQEEFIDCLLESQPATQSLNTVFPRVERLSRSVQLRITRKLLDAGANGTAVDMILKSAMSQPAGQRDGEFIQLLVDRGADVNQADGDLLRLAVQTSDDEILKILLSGSPSPTLLSACVPIAMQLSESQRYKIIQMLLHNSARGDQVSQALVDSIDGTASGCRLSSLLLTAGEANTAFDKGKAFQKAVGSSNLEFLELLVQHNHLDESDFCSCLLVAIDLPHGDSARLEKIRILLTTGVDMSGDTGTTALRHEMQGLRRRGEISLAVLHMLLDAGADVNHTHGRILLDAIQMDLFECFKLFLGANPTFQSLELAFEKALIYAFRTFDLRYIHELLALGVPQMTVDKALLRTTDEKTNEKLALLLLRHGASVNYQEGASVRKAISRLDPVLLGHLLQHEPTAVTLENAFALSMTLKERRAQYEAYNMILKAGMIPYRLLNEALVAAADGGWAAASICELLLENHASPSYANGAPFCRAIKAPDYRVDLMRLFLRFKASEDAVAAALNCAFDVLQNENRLATVELLLTAAKPQLTLDQLLLKTVKSPACDHKLVKCLLNANASVFYQGGQCILHAVVANDVDTLRILKPYFHGHSGVSEIFMTAWGSGKRANSPREEAVLSILLSAGATGECISSALAETVKESSSLPSGFAFIVNLLDAGADVNYNDGVSLSEASSQGNLRVLRELLNNGPLGSNMTRAFPLVFKSVADSRTIREIAVAFCSHSFAPDLTYENPAHGPLLWLVLQNYPEPELVKYLIDKGAAVDPTVRARLPLSSQEENVSLLCWALACDRHTLTEDVIDVLVTAGADVNYQTTLSQSTPLQLAILSSRSNSVATLLRFGADPSIESSNGISPLSLASSIGNSNIVRQLLQAGAAPYDGSLHEAARMVNVDVLRVLLQEGKQRDYPCSRFQGRTALAELFLKASGKPLSQIKTAISLLKEHGDITRKSKGKSVLHFALDNADAILVTQALLDVFMSEHINDEFNIYADGRFRYSPLAYVSRAQNQAPASQRSGLIDILMEFSCKYRFWAAEGDQPPDMIGAPDEIIRSLHAQRQRQARIQEETEDHQRRLAQRRAEQAEELAALKARHDLTLENQREAASETARIEQETAQRHASVASRRYDAELAYMRQVTDLANQRKDDFNHREIEHRRNLALMEKGERDTSYKVERQRREEEIAFVQRREKVLTSGYEDRARIDKERYADQMRLFEVQRQVVEQSSSRPAARQIEYGPELLD